MAFFCKQNREKSSTASHIKNTQFFFFWKLRTYFFHPAFCHGTVQFLTFLHEKTVTSFFPVIDDSLLALIIPADDSSICDHRTISKHLQRAALIKKHTVKLCDTDFFYIAFIIADFSKNITFLDHITDFFKRIPESVFLGILIANIGYIQRIVGTEIFQSLINSQMTENITDIPAGGSDFLISPVTHSSTLDQNTRDSL